MAGLASTRRPVHLCRSSKAWDLKISFISLLDINFWPASHVFCKYQTVWVLDAICRSWLNEKSPLKKNKHMPSLQLFTRLTFKRKFFGHLQPALEYVPVQELILAVLTEEVRRLVGWVRWGDHGPVVTLNVHWMPKVRSFILKDLIWRRAKIFLLESFDQDFWFLINAIQLWA